MIKVYASINKKVPIPGQDYSSRSFGASIEIELSDAATHEQLQTKINELYSNLHEAIDVQISGVTAFGEKPEDFKPPAEQSKPPAQQQPTTPVSSTTNNNGKNNSASASDKQIGLIINLAKDVSVSRSDLNGACQRLFQSDLDHLSKMNASSLIGNLQKIRDGKLDGATLFGNRPAKAA